MKSEDQGIFKKRIYEARVTIALNGKFVSFTQWCKSHDLIGLTPSSITAWLNNLDVWTVDKAEEKVSLLEVALHNFLAFRTNQPLRDYDEIEGKFLNTQWYLYFYYPDPPHEMKAEFGRIVLKISKKGEVSINNVGDNVSPHYKGEFRVMYSNLLVFDLYEDQRGAHLHIKANINPSIGPSEVILGAFLSNGRTYISSGTVVFELRKGKEKLTPSTFSYFNKVTILEEVNINIRRYLSAKSLNYLRVPDKVFRFDKLKEARFGPIAPPSTRFIETGKPILFISCPTYSLSDEKFEIYFEKINALKETMAQKYSDKIEVHFYGYRTEASKRMEYLHVLNEIRRTSLFCLIYLESVSSNALIELGMAYAYSKNVRIYAGKNALPKNGFLKNSSEHIILKELHHQGLEEIFREIESDMDWAIKSIILKIESD